MNEPEQLGLDERTVAFSYAANQISTALWNGEELRTRYMILLSARGVISDLLQTMRFPRDIGLLAELANLNRELTGLLDRIVLDSEPCDPRLAVLRNLAEYCVTWPTLVRPGDQKFTISKLKKLNPGAKASLGSLPPKASFATDANRLTLKLIDGLKNSAESILNIKRNGVRDKSTPEEACQTLLVSGVPRQKHGEFIQILRRVERYPFSAKTLTQWGGILVDYVLLFDLKRFAELRTLFANDVAFTEGLTTMGDERSKLRKFFRPALKNLAAQTERS
jgi:hypothetical protein